MEGTKVPGPGAAHCARLIDVSRPRSTLVKLSESECRELLGAVEIGRVILSIDALPAALPVNFRVIDEAIVFRTAPGTKLAAAMSRAVVGFEVDQIDPATHRGWSVLVVGISQVVTDVDEIAKLDQLGIHSWLTADLPAYVKIGTQRISGRRLAKPTR